MPSDKAAFVEKLQADGKIVAMVGDGINTNEAAAKILWSCVHQVKLAENTRYFLLLVKCATHQAGLSATSSVIGRAASAAGGELHKAIAGVAAWLFKYVLCDYFEEFVFSVREWIVSYSFLSMYSPDRASHGRRHD